MAYQHIDGLSDGIHERPHFSYQQTDSMALTDTFIRQIKYSGSGAGDKHTDGQGMHLLVNKVGKYWRLNYRYLGKQKTLALGVYPDVSLAQARKKRDQARELLASGGDPSAAKRDEKHARVLASENTFEAVARQWLAKEAPGRAEATTTKVTAWLEKNVFPYIGSLAIAELKPRDILHVVQRMEKRGAVDSAHRVKQVCGQIFRFGVALDVVERDITADLRGALSTPVKSNHAAITDPQEVGTLLRAIHGYHGHAAASAALKLAPLVFVRPGELRSAEWVELDLDAAEWRIPASKMKMKTEHLVPLARQAVEILTQLKEITGQGRFVFPSLRTQACMSENTVNAALRGMGYAKEVMTGHGFRAMARTILDEVLEERVDLIEHQLAHAVRDPNGRAYNRTAHLPARRAMMQRWADYLDDLRLGVTLTN